MADAHGIARDQLRSYIDRIERLEDEKKTIGEDIRGIYSEAGSVGFDPKIMRKLVAIRKKDNDERAEEDALLATYMTALGMQLTLFDEAA